MALTNGKENRMPYGTEDKTLLKKLKELRKAVKRDKLLFTVMIAVIALVATGCAYNGQNFGTRTITDGTRTEYEIVQQPDGEWVALLKLHEIDTMDDDVHGKNKSTAPPFNAKNNADAKLSMTEGATEHGDPTWTVDMGQVGEIDGGDIGPVVDSVGDAVVGGLTAGASTVIEGVASGLTNGDN